MGKKNSNKVLNLVQIILFAVAIICVLLYIRDVRENEKQDKVFEEIRERFEIKSVLDSDVYAVSDDGGFESVSVEQENPVSWQDGFNSRKPVYESIQKENADMIGWVHIDDTQIDYPVCYTPSDPEYYLHRDIKKRSSSYGVPFIIGNYEPDSNIIIAGHHMRNGSMFAELMKYVKRDFYDTHRYIHFDSLDQSHVYEVVSVVACDPDGSSVLWEDVMFSDNSDNFEKAWNTVEANQYYDTGIDVKFGDNLLALVTCEYTHKDGRLMVIAKEIWH